MNYETMIKKYGVIFLSAFLMIGYTGCGLLDPAEDTDEVSVSITNDADIDTIAVTGSATTADVEGVIEGSSTPISVTVELTANATDGSTDGITVTTTQAPSDKDKIDIGPNGDMQISIAVAATACIGSYTLEISATVGGETNSTSQTIVVTGATDCSQTGTPVDVSADLTVGANQNTTYGSSIDLDGPNVWLSANAVEAQVDLCYAYSGDASVEKIGTPAWAKASGYNFAASWSANPPETEFYKALTGVTQDVVDAQLATKEQLTQLWTTASAGTAEASYTCAQGDVFIAKTDQNAIAVLWVKSQTAGVSGTITVIVAK
ncbi:MAG: hypothetical protein GF350_13785 [Chitinivibrionales bacterium]|nr:hypothetical protein [Chitinivibrionales bacterium]